MNSQEAMAAVTETAPGTPAHCESSPRLLHTSRVRTDVARTLTRPTAARFGRFPLLSNSAGLALALLASVLFLFAFAVDAQANTTPTLTTTSRLAVAGAHSNLTMATSFSNNGDDVKNLKFDFPAGLVGNPRALNTLCTENYTAGLPDYSNCGAESKIGTISNTAPKVL